jgi:hypothetical protein
MGKACSKHGAKNAYKISVGKPGEKRPLVRPMSRWEIILREILMKMRRECQNLIKWLRTDTMSGFCEYGNEPRCSVKS